MKRIILSLFMMINLAHADELTDMVERINQLANENSEALGPEEKEELYNSLAKAEELLANKVEQETCENQKLTDFNLHFKTSQSLFNFALDSMFLKERASKRFVRQWMKRYSCETLSLYKRQFLYVRTFAIDFKGLKLKSEKKAAKYARKKIESLCINADLYKLYQSSLEAAQYSGTRRPKKVARKAFEAEGFSCILDQKSSQRSF
jgi:hypothetical protein